MAKMFLEVSPGQKSNPNIRSKFVAHMNPETYSEGTTVNWARTLPPGAYVSYKQYIASDEDDITFTLFLNEYGAHYEDLNRIAGHMTVADSLDWFTEMSKPVALGNKLQNSERPPILLFVWGENPVVEVVLGSCKKNILLRDPKTAIPIRAELELTLVKYRKIGL